MIFISALVQHLITTDIKRRQHENTMTTMKVAAIALVGVLGLLHANRKPKNSFLRVMQQRVQAMPTFGYSLRYRCDV